MQWVEWFGYAGAACTLAAFSMKTMVPLRLAGIGANLAFITYGAAAHAHPVLVLHLLLLPMNAWRLRQLLRLTSQIRAAAAGGLAVEWLKPFTRQQAVSAGQTLFRRGDKADEILFVLSGRFLALEAQVELTRGEVFGEIGLVSAAHRRTQTVVCREDGVLLRVTYDEVRQLYFQNPKFGFYILQMVAERLMRDARRAGDGTAEVTPDATPEARAA